MARQCLKCGKDVPPGVVRCTHCDTLMPSEVHEDNLSTRPGVRARWDPLDSLGAWAGQKVYRVKNRTTGLEAALRMLPLALAEDEKIGDRMEAVITRQTALIGLAGVLSVDKYEVEDRTPYFVHDAVKGTTLQDRLKKEKRVPGAEARRIGAAVAEILSRTHSKGLCHGDLRPSSIVLTESGEVMVTDFGVGKVVGDAAARALDGGASGARAGFYRSPEIRKTELPTAASDLYSLGCVLYEAATGEKRFPDGYRAACDDPRRGLPFPDPCVAHGDMDPALRASLRKLLAPHPADRFADAGKAASALQGQPFMPVPILEGAAKWEPPPLPEAAAPAKPAAAPPAGAKKKSSGAAGIAAAGAAAVVLGLAGWWFARPKTGAGGGAIEVEPPVKDLGPAPAAIPDLPPPPTAPLKGRILPDHVAERGGRLWSLVDGAELILVPEGTGAVGADDGAADERPLRRVQFSAYLLDRHEVTVAQFRRYCMATGRRLPPQPAGGTDRHPVVNVSWVEADAFARWAKRRLPTEAEWERAMRGPAGDPFPWGSTDDPARRNGPGEADGHAGLAPCGSLPLGASAFGVLDGIGNAWEWCSDWYAADAYRSAAAKDPPGPGSGSDRVVRGGSCLLGPPLRASFRNRAAPGVRFEDLGFRCAVSLR